MEMTMKLPMVEIFETVEGEGLKAGFLTTFVRLYNCNLRCTWCDTKYSYAPHSPEFFATIEEITEQVRKFGNPSICLTGGEPLMHGSKSLALIAALAELPHVEDIHIETNGAILLRPFHELRESHHLVKEKVRFVLDYKLTSSGETQSMIMENFHYLGSRDEIKFVVGNAAEFAEASRIIEEFYQQGQILFSPVWDQLAPAELVKLMLQSPFKQAKLSLQTHKYIWHPDTKGV
ncbi:radical SAM protein [Ammoniphilus sp. CFH 90114]|uniref:7-carboxy-7-deazaguanine synthase QueE n=1 Tax=Ammoniphilus sp. CFH 90114 TaxID=2493665 RepID=UPI001F0B8D75|nr:radical SAM protein [Ammoniphilus sp. CFH 90114]